MEEDKVVTVEGPVSPRENMISTAVRFLQNPKVTESPGSQKRTFLEKKGLTTEEIDLAMARVGTTNSAAPSQTTGVMTPVPGAYPMAVQPVLPQPVVVSTWTRFKDYTATAIIVAGISYGLYKFYKKYIMPLWFGPSVEERQLAAIQKSISELQTSIKDTLTYIKEMQASINTQQGQLQDMSTGQRPRSSSEEKVFLKDVKDEIKSLKGLLLSRKQFPPTPSSQPVLPAWQLTSTKSDEKPSVETSDAEISETSMLKESSSEDVTVTQPEVVPATDTIPGTATDNVPGTATDNVLGTATDNVLGTATDDVLGTATDNVLGTATTPEQVVIGDPNTTSETAEGLVENEESSALVNGHLTNGLEDDKTDPVQSMEHLSHTSSDGQDQQPLCSTVAVES